MPTLFSKSAPKSLVPPRPTITLQSGTGLCIMEQAWKCTSRRRPGSCYCSGHTCGHTGCIEVVATSQSTLCQRHQLVASAPDATPGAESLAPTAVA